MAFISNFENVATWHPRYETTLVNKGLEIISVGNYSMFHKLCVHRILICILDVYSYIPSGVVLFRKIKLVAIIRSIFAYSNN